MLVIKIELWPLGHEGRKRTLGIAKIRNDATGTLAVGNYTYEIYGEKRPIKNGKGRVTGFFRSRKNAWHLLRQVLNQALDDSPKSS